MSGPVILVAGLSGVGKSTAISRIKELQFLHLSASELIKEELARNIDQTPTSEELRTGPVLDNQSALIAGFKRRRAGWEGAVLFDAHLVIDTGPELLTLPIEVFDATSVDGILLLEERPEVIAERRKRDDRRRRPDRLIAELTQHQERQQERATEIATELTVPLIVTNTEGFSETLCSLVTSLIVRE